MTGTTDVSIYFFQKIRVTFHSLSSMSVSYHIKAMNPNTQRDGMRIGKKECSKEGFIRSEPRSMHSWKQLP